MLHARAIACARSHWKMQRLFWNYQRSDTESLPSRDFSASRTPSCLARALFRAPDDYYFIVEDADSGERHGTIRIYEIETKVASANGGDGF